MAWLWIRTGIVLSLACRWCPVVSAKQQPLGDSHRLGYSLGQSFEVDCLNRSIATGEHITDDAGNQQYIPFPTCSETGKPLELEFGVEKGTAPPFLSSCRMTMTRDLIES
jgi:hypothetical protein